MTKILITVLAGLLAAAPTTRTYPRDEVLRIAQIVYACGKIDGSIEVQRSMVPWASAAEQQRLKDIRAHAHSEEVDKLLKEGG